MNHAPGGKRRDKHCATEMPAQWPTWWDQIHPPITQMGGHEMDLAMEAKEGERNTSVLGHYRLGLGYRQLTPGARTMASDARFRRGVASGREMRLALPLHIKRGHHSDQLALELVGIGHS